MPKLAHSLTRIFLSRLQTIRLARTVIDQSKHALVSIGYNFRDRWALFSRLRKKAAKDSQKAAKDTQKSGERFTKKRRKIRKKAAKDSQKAAEGTRFFSRGWPLAASLD